MIQAMTTVATTTLPDVEEILDHKEGLSYMPMYRVIMWDDNVTTMEFVIRILIHLFGKDFDSAEQIMYEIHNSGSAYVATLPLEQAEFKVEQVHNAAAMEQFPFTCTIERE